MHSLIQFLTELKASSVRTKSFKKILDNKGRNIVYQARIQIDNPEEPENDIITVRFRFVNIRLLGGTGNIGLDAKLIRKGLMQKALDGDYEWYFHFTVDDALDVIDIEPSKQKGAGEAAFVIISNVEKSFNDFMQEVVPESFVFIGANPKKIKVYDLAARKILRQFPTYKLERKNIMPGKVFLGSRELIKYGFRRKNVIS